MAQYLGPAFQQALTASAVPYSGGLLYVYVPSTTTPIALFSDETLSTPAANPIVADSSGSFAPVFIAETRVKLILKTSAGVTVRTIDPAYSVGVANNITAADVTYDGTSSGLASDNAQDAIDEIVTLQGLAQSWTSSADGPIATGTSTNAGAAAGPLVEMYRNSASPAASDVIGGRRDTGKNAAATKVTYTQDHTVILDTTNGSEDAKRVVQTMVAGALADRVHIGGGVWGDGATGGDPGTGKANWTEVQQDGNAIRPIISGTVQATTSGTTKDFSSIPSWAKKITIMLSNISTSGSSAFLIQIGDAGGIETTGYTAACSTENAGASSTAGFIVTVASSQAYSGSVVLTLANAATFRWTSMGCICIDGQSFSYVSGGSKALSAALDRVRLTTASADTMDAGEVNILYE